MTISNIPYWVPKGLEKTVGGQPVGFRPLHCESNGGSDYCRHCGRDMGHFEGRDPVCPALEELRLAMIPDEEVVRHYCSGDFDESPCKKWCKSRHCPVELRTQLSLEQEARNKLTPLGWLAQSGMHLLNDDRGHWALSNPGMHPVAPETGFTTDVSITVIVFKDDWHSSPEAAIKAAREKENHEARTDEKTAKGDIHG